MVKERENINWFETRPLFGKRVAVTRTRAQAGSLSKRLKDLGAQVLEMPTIKTTLPDQKESMVSGVTDAHKYDWIVFSSPNGVEYFFNAFFKAYADARSLGGARIATVGPATARKLKEYHFASDLIPEKHIAEGLVDAFKEQSIEHQTILYVKAETTRDVVTEGLTKQGAIVDECVVYKTVAEMEDPTGAKAEFKENGADYITFTSGSTGKYFHEFGLEVPEECRIASIGPITTEVLGTLGYTADLEATEHNIDGLVEAILADATKEA